MPKGKKAIKDLTDMSKEDLDKLTTEEKEDLLTDSEKNLMGALETARGLLPEVRNAAHPYFSSLFMILMGRSIKDGKENFDAYAVALHNTITEFINRLWEIREKEKANDAPNMPE